MTKFFRCYDVIPSANGYVRRNAATSYVFQTDDPLVAARAASAKMDSLLMDGGHDPAPIGTARIFDVAPIGADVHPMVLTHVPTYFRVRHDESGYVAEPFQMEGKGKT